MDVDVRERLLGEAVQFVHQVRETPGVRSIALLGSITTSKPTPKDIDFLLAVDDGADLGVLAIHSRRLMGRLQGFNLTADIFLADGRGQYLGRVCHWRECRSGKRASCDAWHCGRRPHLHDDFGAVRLSPDLIAAPPLGVWPTVVRRGRLPADLEAWLATVADAV